MRRFNWFAGIILLATFIIAVFGLSQASTPVPQPRYIMVRR